jgi:hypothetical protein
MSPLDGKLQKILGLTGKAKAALYAEDRKQHTRHRTTLRSASENWMQETTWTS